jgi:hypothetical protein
MKTERAATCYGARTASTLQFEQQLPPVPDICSCDDDLCEPMLCTGLAYKRYLPRSQV